MDSLIQFPQFHQVTVNVRQTSSEVSTLFEEALRDPSNLELDWLWLAAHVTHERERSYCFQQALRINPCSEQAKRGLAQLDQQFGAPIDVNAWSQAAFRNT